MNNLKRFGFVSRELGKKSSLGLLLSMAKQELARTEGILAQVQEVRDRGAYFGGQENGS